MRPNPSVKTISCLNLFRLSFYTFIFPTIFYSIAQTKRKIHLTMVHTKGSERSAWHKVPGAPFIILVAMLFYASRKVRTSAALLSGFTFANTCTMRPVSFIT